MKLCSILALLSFAELSIIFFEVIDRESPTTGVWVLDWVIYNRIINTFLAKLERWTREPPADYSRKIVRQTGLTTQQIYFLKLNRRYFID